MCFKKVVASALTAACLCTSLSVTAFAETNTTYSLIGGVSPLYEIATSASSMVGFNGTTAECISKATGFTSTTAKITVEHTLQKYSSWFWRWNDVEDAHWTRTVDDSVIYLLSYKDNLSKGKYRLKSVFTLTDKNGKTETITIYSMEDSLS